MNKQNYFSRHMLYRFFIPAILSSFTLSFGNIINALVVGRSMSKIGLAAIALTAPIYMIINLFSIAFSLGGSLTYAKHLGEGYPDKAEQCFHQIFWVHAQRMLLCTLQLLPI